MRPAFKVSLNIKAPIASEFANRLEYTNFKGRKFYHDLHVDPLTERTVERLKLWVEKKPESCEREDLVLLGLHLYKILFPPGSDLRSEFESDLQFVKDQPGGRLRLTIVLHEEAKKLATYPWEFLCLDAGDQNLFLVAQDAQLILTRFVKLQPLPGMQPVSGKPLEQIDQAADQKLRILVAFAAPAECGMLGKGPETLIGKLQAMEKGSPESIELKVLKNVTLPDLQRELQDPDTRFDPHVVHFIGHGSPGKLAVMATQDERELRRANENNNEAHWLDAQPVSDLFVNWKPRLVFLHACDTATPAESLKGMTDVASYIIRRGIPAVVGMQYPIPNEDAVLFATTFYEKLTAGWDIDEAVKAGRSKLGERTTRGQTFEDRRFATPIFYLMEESEATIIKPKGATAGDSGTNARAPLRKPDCPYSDCDGKVSLGAVLCIRCRRALDKCPKCGFPIAKASDVCGHCGWGSSPTAGATTATPTAEAERAAPSVAQTAFSDAIAGTQAAAQPASQDPRLRLPQ